MRPRRLPALTLATGLVLGLGVTLLGPAAQAAEVFPVPRNGSIPLTGHGYGHGHGMSQYGARGAAQQGLSHAQILDFYYPGTEMGRAGGMIRVKISADTDGDTRVPVQSGLRVREVSSGEVIGLPGRLAGGRVSQWRMRTGGGTVLEGYAANAWRRLAAFAGPGVFQRPGASSITLRLPSGDRAYRGVLRHDGGLTINTLTLDNMVKGVVASEMPASWEAAAVRAQAVAARTYAAFDRAANATRSWQTCDTTSCQVYGGVAAEHPLATAAVEATARQVRTYRGAVAFTQFSSSSGGWTSAGSQPYLVAKRDPYDATPSNANHTWRTTLTRGRVQAAYPSLGTLRRVVVTARDGNGDWGGRVESVTLDGSQRDVVLSGSGFRSAFGLRSDWFKLG